jgi:amino acid transporter
MTATPTAPTKETNADAERLAQLGYKQKLTRSVGLWSNFAVGFTYLSPVVGVYSLFAYGLGTGGPAMVWTIPIVLLGQFLVALVFAEVASEFPLAGGIYQWSKRLIGNRYAWLAGWTYTWALLITVASVAFSANLYAAPLFGYQISTANNILVAVAIIVLGGVVNLLGVRRLAVVANLGVVAEISLSLVLAIILLVKDRHHSLGILMHTEGAGAGNYLGAFLAAALFSVWIFYGFEACGDIAEEVIDPSRKVPRAMRYTLYIGGAVSVLITVALVLATPDIGKVISGEDADPISGILSDALGTNGSKVALAFILIAYTSCALAIQAAAVRLIYAYGRDGMILGAKRLSKVHPKLHMPPGAVAIAVLIPAVIVFMPSATVAKIITFAVVGIYLGFQSVVLATLWARYKGWRPAGHFRLGRIGPIVNVLALGYGVSAIVILCLKTPSAGRGFIDRWLVPISAFVVVALGLLYMLIFRPKEAISDEDRPDAPAFPVAAS